MNIWTPQFWEPSQKPEPGFDEINWDHPHANGLVGCWLFNEGAGRSFHNKVDGGSSLSPGSAVWTQGQGGIGVKWNDVGTYTPIRVPYSPSLRPSNITIVFGRETTSLGSDFAQIYGAYNLDTELDLCFVVIGGNNCRFRQSIAGSSAFTTVANLVSTGYHQYAVSRSTTGAQRWYRDAVLFTTASGGAGTIDNTGIDLGLGGAVPGGFNCQNQRGIYTYIYNYVLSDAMINDIHSVPFGMFSSGLPRSEGAVSGGLLLNRRRQILAA